VEPETRYARNGEVHIAYRVWGDGPFDLVMLAGFVSHVELLWEFPATRRYLERFGAFARVISFDRRGTGLSDPFTVERAPDLETRMSDLVAVLDAAGSTRAALYAQSEGGPTAILFAATHPERTRALVLNGSMARTTYADDHPWLPTVDDFNEAGIELLLPSWGRGPTIDVSAPSMGDDPDFVAFYGRLERTSVTPGMLASVAAMFYDTDVRAVLPSVNVPTLVLHRKGDRLVNVRSGRYVAENIPGARFVEIPGCDHTPWFQHPEMYVDEIQEFLTGNRATATPERRLATVMFSDIVASTERAAGAGDAEWRDLLDRHHRAVRGELERFGGTEIKTLGDGFLATFEGPTAGTRGAIAVRAATAAVGLPVRVGLHCGEIEITPDDIAGISVHIAARVCALAGSGEVLVSRTVKDLVAGSGIAFESRGTHTLKGIPDDWDLFRVV
jgi:pimeloyl-ACP methyl ester carboxylesterase/class 3 adenylate cyclase